MIFLGVITVGAGVAKNNVNTAASFALSKSVSQIYLQSDAAGVQFEFGNGDAFATTAAHGAFLAAANTLYGPFPTGDTAPNVSVFNPTVGSVNVRVFEALG